MTARVGYLAPDFSVQAFDCSKNNTDQQFTQISLGDYRGKWVCLYFYPLDFTFVCPTEIVRFNESLSEFTSRNCVVLTASTDSVFSHKAWCESHPDLKKMQHPMLADTSHALSTAYGVLKDDAGIAFRGTFLIDPNGVVRWACMNDLPVGRDVNEVLRVLDALQTDKLTPCGWKKGDKTLN
ncbi:MAG: peroxiredoxin [Planctomycetaceae bacterium]|nr:peroxiredoxin [Planctomycetaceae bacterium]